jgi:hypothetical protein
MEMIVGWGCASDFSQIRLSSSNVAVGVRPQHFFASVKIGCYIPRGLHVSTRMKVAFGCYLLVVISMTAWGVDFMLRDEFTPYHSVAVGMPWAEVPRQFQVLILALIKLAGGLWITIAACILVLLFKPFRRREPWALWAVPVLIVIELVAPIPAMAYVVFNTPAKPPLLITLVFVGICFIGMAMSLTEKSDRGI